MILVTILKNIAHKLCSVENVLKIKLTMGFYYNFRSSRYISLLVKLYCIFVSTIVSFLPIICIFLIYDYIFENNFNIMMYCGLSSVEVFIYSISCLYTSESSFHRFCSMIKIIDTTLGLRTPLRSPFILFLYCYILLQILISILLILRLPNLWIMHISINLLIICNTMIFATTIITYNLFYERMKLIKRLLRNHLLTFNKLYVVQRYLLTYKNLLNNVQNNNKGVTFIYFVNILISFIKITYHTYFTVDKLLNKVFWDVLVYISLFEIILLVICLLLPGVLCELATAEYEEIKLTLAYELLQCTDQELGEALSNGLEYLEYRPPSISIYRLFPVDISLFTGFIHVCVTYIIVLLQTAF